MNKSIVIGVIIAILALGGAFWASRSGGGIPTEQTPSMPKEGTSSGTSAGGVGSVDPAPALGMPAPGMDPRAVEEMVVNEDGASSPVKVYTKNQVALNNTAESCWSIVGGMVYDLTAWIEKHPGGSRPILRMCGVDSSKEFEEAHGSEEKAKQALAGFELGLLAD